MAKEDRLLIFLAGLGVGVAGTLLFAPASGSEMRSRLKDGLEKTGDYLKDQAVALKRPLEDVVAQGKQMFGDTVAKGNDAMSNVIDKSKDLAHQAGKTMEKGGKRLQDV